MISLHRYLYTSLDNQHQAVIKINTGDSSKPKVFPCAPFTNTGFYILKLFLGSHGSIPSGTYTFFTGSINYCLDFSYYDVMVVCKAQLVKW